ncbi:MAG: putative sodium-coupled permease, partial [uncultured Cytophagales bacterium]
ANPANTGLRGHCGVHGPDGRDRHFPGQVRQHHRRLLQGRQRHSLGGGGHLQLHDQVQHVHLRGLRGHCLPARPGGPHADLEHRAARPVCRGRVRQKVAPGRHHDPRRVHGNPLQRTDPADFLLGRGVFQNPRQHGAALRAGAFRHGRHVGAPGNVHSRVRGDRGPLHGGGRPVGGGDHRRGAVHHPHRGYAHPGAPGADGRRRPGGNDASHPRALRSLQRPQGRPAVPVGVLRDDPDQVQRQLDVHPAVLQRPRRGRRAEAGLAHGRLLLRVPRHFPLPLHCRPGHPAGPRQPRNGLRERVPETAARGHHGPDDRGHVCRHHVGAQRRVQRDGGGAHAGHLPAAVQPQSHRKGIALGGPPDDAAAGGHDHAGGPVRGRLRRGFRSQQTLYRPLRHPDDGAAHPGGVAQTAAALGRPGYGGRGDRAGPGAQYASRHSLGGGYAGGDRGLRRRVRAFGPGPQPRPGVRGPRGSVLPEAGYAGQRIREAPRQTRFPTRHDAPLRHCPGGDRAALPGDERAFRAGTERPAGPVGGRAVPGRCSRAGAPDPQIRAGRKCSRKAVRGQHL